MRKIKAMKTTAIEQFRKINNSEIGSENQPRSNGRISTLNIEALYRELVEQQPQTSTPRLLSAELGPFNSTIVSHLNKIGLVNWHCRREVPHDLTTYQKH